MQNLLEELKYVFKNDERIILNDGSFSKNKLMELALSLDETLLESLLKFENIKSHFFKKVGETYVFNQPKFIQFIQNKQLFKDSYTSYKNIIGLKTDKGYFKNINDVSLVWAYKDCVLEGGQNKEDAKRNEIFYNELLAPDEINRLIDKKVLTNWKRFDANGEHEVDYINDNDNLIIKGNNLLALHSIESKFSGRVKLIYIDPPYNTGSDSFKYNDKFNHSTWLTFMKNRLKVAKEFLTPDGVIFIQIDDKEVHYLKVLCDEIFGKSNFLNTIVVKTSDPSGHKVVNPSPYSQTEYILMYAKNKQYYKYDIYYVPSEYDPSYNKYIVNFEDGYESWKIVSLPDYVAKNKGYSSVREAKDKLGEKGFFELMAQFALANKDRVFQATAISDDAGKEIVKVRDESKKNKDKVYYIPREDYEDIYILNGRQMYFYSSKVKTIFGEEVPAKPLTNLWTDIPYNGISNEGGVTLKNGKKPEKLLHRIIEISTKEGDIVLDFFLGSGTTAAVAHKMNRQYIGIEQLDYGKNDCVNRLINVIKGDKSGISSSVGWEGGGSFVYVELMRLNEAFIDKIQAAGNTYELLEIWKEMKEHAFLRYDIDPENIDNSIEGFKKLSFENQKKLLIECLDKNNLYVNLSEIEDTTYNVSEKEIDLNRAFYCIGDPYGK